jgi:cobalt-zinc-cadmium resistance protein CzcA
MKRLVDWLDKNHVAIMFSLVVVTLTGIYFYFDLPKDVFPKGDFPRFQIIADIGFASLEETEINVTRPIEEAVKTVPDVTEVRSVTERGTSTVDIYLKWGSDLNQAFQYIQSKISQIRGSLSGNLNIDIVRMTTSAYPMSEYGIWSDDLDQKKLYTIVKYTIIPKLIGIDGVYGLSVIGGQEPEIWVKFDPQKLIKYNLDTTAIGDAIDNANRVSFIGNVLKDKNSLFTAGGEKLADTNEIGEVVIASRMGRPLYLKDVAKIDDFHAETRRIVSVNGHEGLFIDVQKQQNADGLKVSKSIDEKMAELEDEFRGHLHIAKWDLSDFVSSSIHGIMLDIFIGIVIILLIVYYIMNRFRYSLPVILVLPVVIILEFLILKILGLNVNIMTLGGLSAAIGIIADNAIVITENYARFKAEGITDNPLSSSLTYIVPITAWATLVSIIVFVPLSMLSGVSGLFFKPLAVTLATTIIISLLMAVFVIPVFIKYFIENYKGPIHKVRERFFFNLIKRAYITVLNTALKFKWLIVGLSFLLIAWGILIFFRIPNGFLPEWDEGDIVFDYIAPGGTSIYGTDEIIKKVEEIIKKTPDVKMYIRKTGTHLGTPFAPSNVGEIVILLDKNKKHSTFQIMDRLRNEVAKSLPELDTDLHQILPDRIGDLTGATKPIVVNIIGNDLDKLRNVAEEVKSGLEKIKGLNGVLVDMPPPQEEIKVSANQENASLLGINIGEIYRYSQLALYGEVVSNIQRGLQTIPVRQFYEGYYRNNVDNIVNIPVYTPEGGILPLGKLATFTLVNQIPEVRHKNGSLVINVNAEISGRALGDVVKDIKNTLSTIKNGNFTTELTGSYKDQQKSFMELLVVLLVSIILILALLLFIFESYKTAVAVFLGTLCSATFVISGLFITRTEFDVSSFTGMIAVMGIVVNNGILVIDFVERFRRDGRNLIDSIKQAGNLRFRPVLITNLAAMAGFLPMALNIGRGGEVLQPFSIAMISGLIGSMFFSLVFMPIFYLIMHLEYIK